MYPSTRILSTSTTCKHFLSTTSTTPAFTVGSSLAQARLHKEKLGTNKTSSLTQNSPDILTNPNTAYEAQLANHTTLIQHGNWNLTGYKIGATSTIVQERIGLKTPFWGRLYDQCIEKKLTQNQKTHRFSLSQDLIRGVEAEFAFTLKKEIPAAGNHKIPYTPTQLLSEYVSTIMPAVEICASRAPTNSKPTSQALIADSGGNGSVILGNESLITIDDSKFNNIQSIMDILEISTTQVSIDGEIIATGCGKNVLGNPLNSLAWFVNVITGPEFNISLLPNQTIITGATCGLIPIIKPCYVKVSFLDWRGGWKSDLAFRA